MAKGGWRGESIPQEVDGNFYQSIMQELGELRESNRYQIFLAPWVNAAYELSPLAAGENIEVGISGIYNDPLSLSGWGNLTLGAVDLIPVLKAANRVKKIACKGSKVTRIGKLTIEAAAKLDSDEMAIAQLFVNKGYDVRGLATASDKGFSGVKTSDLFVDGIGHIDVYT